MKKNQPPRWLCAALLALALLWRMVGAPLTAEQFAHLQTPIEQARILLPSRMQRIGRLWLGPMRFSRDAAMPQDVFPSDENPQAMLNIYLAQENRMAQMSLEGYVCGVLAAEMPAQYHLEALKAQAVAARTRALWQQAHGGCALHPGADLCTDSAHCQGYATPAECRERWGASYQPYCDRILRAQRETQGQVLTYAGELITVLYHAISGGRTEDAQTVFSSHLPYLVSVESAGEETTRGFRQDQTISYQQMADAFEQRYPGHAADAQQVKRTFAIDGYTASGRVAQVQLCGQRIPATEFRAMLGLRSTWFSISSNADGITFHQQGYGHGVGMSQAGANGMAADGKRYDEILLHYYPGVALAAHE